MVQVAIAMTCPKTPFVVDGGLDGFPEGNFNAPDEFKPAEITQEEQDTLAELMAKLGL